MTGMIVLEPADITAELGSNVTFDSVGVIDCNDCDNYQWFTLNADGFVIDITHQFMRGRINSATYTNIQFFDPDDTSTFVSTRVQLNPGGNSIVGQRDVSLTVVGECVHTNTYHASYQDMLFCYRTCKYNINIIQHNVRIW